MRDITRSDEESTHDVSTEHDALLLSSFVFLSPSRKDVTSRDDMRQRHNRAQESEKKKKGRKEGKASTATSRMRQQMIDITERCRG